MTYRFVEWLIAGGWVWWLITNFILFLLVVAVQWFVDWKEGGFADDWFGYAGRSALLIIIANFAVASMP